jgi:alginate O-acetyltransferase complex protein AlgI
MTFTSPIFYLFFPAVFLAFCFLHERKRWLLLLIASYGFYAIFRAPYLLLVLAFVTLIGYAGGLWVGNTKVNRHPGVTLGVCISACLAALFFVKYLPHVPAMRNRGLLSGVISVGVSYFTFQAISYLIDVYWGDQEPEMHLGHFALYMAFFPKLLQGPIERAHHFLPQVRNRLKLDYTKVRSGMLLFALGLFSKVVIADRIARYVNSVYDNVHSYTGLSLILATYCYAIQIYFDFAGYTDMARGAARIFNLDLTENFNHPYAAASVTDFWRRWHISFSRWIFDYIFKPLQLQWRNWHTAGTAAALIVTFFASGVWHGASWGFVIWGLVHGIYLATAVLCRPWQKRLHHSLGVQKSRWYHALQVIITFNLVSFAWIFFRANNLRDAWYVVAHLATPLARFARSAEIFGGPGTHSVFLCLGLMVLFVQGRERMPIIQQRPFWIRWSFYFAILYCIAMFGIWGTNEQFVYFAF